MKVPFANLHAQYQNCKDEIDHAINEVIASGNFIGGDFVPQFEKQFAETYEAGNCIGVANGTDAIFIALTAMGIGKGDEIITVAMSWISTADTISRTGATPVFVDMEADGCNIDVALVAEKITAQTKAIMVVHLYGHPTDMDPILSLCKQHDLRLIADCAQAHFAEYKGARVGLLGDVATFSFYPTKNLGAYGDAGAIITNDSHLAIDCRRIASQGALERHHHEVVGINSRLDSMQAAILSAKLPHVLQWNKERRRIAQLYNQLLIDISEVKTPVEKEYATAVYHLYVIQCERRDDLKEFLESQDIGVSIHYPTPLPLQPAYQHLNYKLGSIPVAHRFSQQILSLPIYPEMTDEMCAYVASKIRSFYANEHL